MNITEAKALIERKNKMNPLSKLAAYYQNERHINSRRDALNNLLEQGRVTEAQHTKMVQGYIRQLQDKFL